MKKFLLHIIFFFAAGFSIAQPGEWVWIHGPNAVNDPGVFGVQGVSDPANNPPSLYEACEWTDQNGNLWLYGGVFGSQEYGDLWKYNPATNEWTWMKGTGVLNAPANYGPMGVSLPTNHPGARGWGMASWVDNQGNLWMLGGLQQTQYADLWRYEPSTNNWTWMKGPAGTASAGVYGTQGIADPANYPASRHETAVTWTDSIGDLWLFGGNGIYPLNDLWRYNISTNEWTWMKGSQTGGAPDVYGIQGVEDTANTPGGRNVYSHWKDKNGNLWLFGGTDFSWNEYNDLWRYNPATNNWAWFKGGMTNGIYGTRCVADSLNTPCKRFECRATVTDSNGNFWLFGGVALDSFFYYYNDLWMYCVTTNKWTWVSGDSVSNQPGNWGSIGVSSPLNKPSCRYGALMWIDQNDQLYLFGGAGIDKYSDLWMYKIDPSCAPCSTQPLALFTAPNQICPGTCIDFINASLFSTSYLWNFQGGNPIVSTDFNPTSICYNAPGNYDVTLIAFNGVNSDTMTLVNYITVFPTPPPQGILQIGDTLIANQGATSYQWYFNGNIIPGATEYFYVATSSGDFNVVATDANGCEVEAVINDVIAGISELDGQPALLTESSAGLAIFPNPVNDKLEIRNLTAGTNITIIIYNNVGEKVYESIEKNVPEDLSIDVKAFTAGLYYLEVSDGKTSTRKVFTKR